jgi:hypothetical protein
MIERDGRPVQLSRRHTEILALLASHPQGMTTEELAADLRGDLGSTAGVRVEMHRLRKALGAAIDPNSYRLATDVESDIARVRGLLARARFGRPPDVTRVRCSLGPRRPAWSGNARRSRAGSGKP